MPLYRRVGYNLSLHRALLLETTNSLLYGLSSKDIKRLQRLQNRAAKLIFTAKKSDHVSPLLQQLHWLPIQERIIFKLLTVTYKCWNETAPPYLTELITPYQPNRTLRSSSDTRILTKPQTRYTSSSKGFYAAAPNLWNNLHYQIRHAQSLSDFKISLKTHLSHTYFAS